jgi:serum/glucocorticoid-regulated kinase 2
MNKINNFSQDFKDSNIINFIDFSSEKIFTIKPNNNDNYIYNESNEFTIKKKEKKIIINFSSFEIIDILGKGSFGKVFLVKPKFITNDNNTLYAMKVINKKNLKQNKLLMYAITEFKILKMANSPFIINLHYAFQTEENLYLILDYCEGGDLSYYLNHKKISIESIKFIIAELILAIEYLHKNNIIYRDLKPENILIDKNNHIKLTDFGLSKNNVLYNNSTKSFCGSPAYLSPEMVNREGVNKSADIYGIGVVLHELLFKITPFYDTDIKKLLKNIKYNTLNIPNYYNDKYLYDILNKMLNKDPQRRIKINEIKKHKFFENIDWEKLEKKEIENPENFIDYKNKNKNETAINKEIKKNLIKQYKDKDYSFDKKDNEFIENFYYIKEK